ncbi:hypothetical protein Pelo_5193 [Pelomyxa schiedti]|nr:hypothetical protein Pelo_5193 [Pelomyxa schiedti]
MNRTLPVRFPSICTFFCKCLLSVLWIVGHHVYFRCFAGKKDSTAHGSEHRFLLLVLASELANLVVATSRPART